MIDAFPIRVTKEVQSLLGKINLTSNYSFVVTNERTGFNSLSQTMHIPDRIYYNEPDETNLTKTESLILNCYFSRHHDGYIRQKRLKRILGSNENWAMPYIVLLIGEYVEDILIDIDGGLDERLLDLIIDFMLANMRLFRKKDYISFYDLTRQRVISYWKSYYVSPAKNEYVGFAILDKIEKRAKVRGVKLK